jgi:thymidine kinase
MSEINLIPITFFSGPMRSGKSTRLMAELQRNSYRKNIIVTFFRSHKDTREFLIRSSLGELDMERIKTERLEKIQDLGQTNADVIGLDELHFYEEGIVDILLDLYLAGKEIYVAGLTVDANGIPWKSTQKLLCSPEVNVIRSFAACEWCGNRWASRTFGKFGNVGVGDAQYEAICFACWDSHFKEKQKSLEI